MVMLLMAAAIASMVSALSCVEANPGSEQRDKVEKLHDENQAMLSNLVKTVYEW
jgi:hypothetical protein